MPVSNDDPNLLGQRKADHIHLCNDENVEARDRRTLLDQVQLIHDSLPELDVESIDMSASLAGHALKVPLMVSGMTGGVELAGKINRILAQVADEHGMAFGVGSQRAMMKDPSVAASYQVRDVAPNVVLCGNIGAVQARDSSIQELADLVGTIDANALCIHVNPGQEMIQDHGDRDFAGCLDGISRAVEGLDVPVIVKETGCGLSPRTLARILETGVQTVDVSGVGGTTWVGVEALRGRGLRQSIGDALWDWGIPTAASVAFAARTPLQVVASGGIRSGLDAARAIALGADVVSAALPYLRAAMSGGVEEARKAVRLMIETLRTVMLLSASNDLAALQSAPKLLGPDLERWLQLD